MVQSYFLALQRTVFVMVLGCYMDSIEGLDLVTYRALFSSSLAYKDWHEMLPFSLHGYRTTTRTSTGATLYSLIYDMEVFLPIEVQIPSLRIMKDVWLNEDD